MPLPKPAEPSAPVLSQFSLKGKLSAVTGGAGGIGREVVLGLAEAGSDVTLIYDLSRHAEAIALDVTKQTSVMLAPEKQSPKPSIGSSTISVV